MTSQCLPFSQIPHTTKLFADYISDFRKVARFYSTSPYEKEWLRKRGAFEHFDPARRGRVAEALERQNRIWGASGKTLENIGNLRRGAAAVVTGQQVGLFGGPAFSIYKALSALKLAQQAREAGVEAVPIFWLATTDHDLAEINHVSIPGPQGTLQKFASQSSGNVNAPVGKIVLQEEIQALVEAAAELLGETDVTTALRDSYRPGVTLGDAYGHLFTRIFKERGLILLDADDPELHAIAAPMYRAAIEKSAELDEQLLKRGKELESAGYHQQVKVTPSSTLLFSLHSGARVPIHRRVNGGGEPEFLIEEERISEKNLLQRITGAPEAFSANVLLRPVIQDYLLPTIAYIGGAAEVAYFAQVDVIYRALLGEGTPILPRFSATIVEPKIEKLMKRYGLSLPQLFHGIEPLRETLASKTLPDGVQGAFDQADDAVEKSLAAVREHLEKLDKTLSDSTNQAANKMKYQLKRLRGRAARAKLTREEILSRHAETLMNALYPDKALQEREVAGIYFLARHGSEFLSQLYEQVHTDCLDHQVITV
ncbi:MAG TPA: bacillithiol biosynthesis cysteine-adding enzyme BshC [Terriglobales bacterium]